LGGFGVSMKKDHPIGAGILAWSWPDYLDPSLAIKGGAAAITGHQRLFPIAGKHSSNYGAAVKDGNLARSLGTDELIYLAPYLIDKNGHEYWTDPKNAEAKLRDGVLSDGPGEECVAISADQRTLIYTPMRANRLGGTTLQYIIDHLADKIGLQTREGDITLHDIRSGKYSAVAMIGNAVKVTPMREIRLYRDENTQEVLELFPEKQIPEMLQTLMDRWDQETRGLIDPSHPSLITPVK
jgi:branched-subunit amino acid aminotransferase/4-amino-4-deoxychorismate lyase